MIWSTSDVEMNLLAGKLSSLALAPEAALAAVNRVERMLGPDWIASRTRATKGIYPALSVIELGLQLGSLDGLAKSDRLVERIRLGEFGALAELAALHIFRSLAVSTELELYPAVQGREADFRLRKAGEDWTTVEVTRPNTSREEERVRKILQQLIDSLKKMEHAFTLNVVFRREPNQEEIAALAEHLPEFCKLPNFQTAKLNEELGFLFLNFGPVTKVVAPEIPELAEIPMVGLTMFMAGGPDEGPLYQVSVQIPFTDERAKEFLRTESKQLPKDGGGLIMIYMGHSETHMRSWERLTARCFQPNVFTRVSGVCLFSDETMPTKNGYRSLQSARFISNPHARIQLPLWILESFALIEQEFERAATEDNLEFRNKG